jgi:hypothetical protein
MALNNVLGGQTANTAFFLHPTTAPRYDALGRPFPSLQAAVPAMPGPTVPAKSPRLQAALDAIKALTVEDIIGPNGELTYVAQEVSNLSATRYRDLNAEYYRSSHYTRYNQYVREQQAAKARIAQKARDDRVEWLKTNLQVGDWIEAGYGAHRQRCVIGITPHSVDTLVGDPVRGKTTGRTVREVQYTEIFNIWDPEAQKFNTVQDVSGIKDPSP